MALARCNGTILVDDGGKLGIVESGGGWIGTAIFVALLLAVLPAMSGVAMILADQPAGFAMVAVSVLAAAAAVVLVQRKRRDQAATTHPAPWLVFDVPAGVVRDRTGAVLGPIDQVRLVRVGQLASSSRALAAYCPAKIVIARGTPFGDSVEQLEHALRSRGIGR